MKLRVIPEYEKVNKLYLCFVQEFYNSRFRYGKAITGMIKAALPFAGVEVFVDKDDMKYFEKELKEFGISLYDITINFNSPKRSIINEWAPIFCVDENGRGAGLTFNWLSEHEDHEVLSHCEKFGSSWVKELGLREEHLNFDFSTAAVIASGGKVLVTDVYCKKNAEWLSTFKQMISQKIITMPSLKDEPTKDLDTYLLAIKPGVWIISDYPKNSEQAETISYAVNVLKELGHTVHYVPGLERIRYEDINTFPNYTNCVILNNAVLVPSYLRKEDEVIKGILSDYGFEAFPIDSRDIILSNSGPHCISKTIPEIIFAP
jgi:agmatine/peptidylarginine deiminase